jgi:CDP-diacylglycerol--glycerol-3-phosphate 3-phosphatidyltransferase
VILFGFVSGLREFLGDTAGTLKVTEWLSGRRDGTVVPSRLLFAQGVFERGTGLWYGRRDCG